MLTLSIIFGVVLTYLGIVIFAPILKVDRQPIKVASEALEAPKFRENVEFMVDGVKISAWFYKSIKEEVKPCIVMNHGFSGTKDMELEKYAIKFVEAGYSVLAYDFRFYGESGGEPRHLYSGPHQVEDLKAAIAYARTRDDVDADKIILWGTSASANYGIVVASEDDRIAAVIGQCGSFDHKEDSKMYMDDVGIGYFLKLFIHGQRDKGRSRFGLSPHKYPAYGYPGTIAMIARKGVVEGIARLAENSTTFVNETCARLALMPHAKDPLKVAHNVKCPVLLLVCTEDNLVSPRSHIRLAEILGERAKVVEYPIDHFDIYFDEWFDKASDDMVEFLKHSNI